MKRIISCCLLCIAVIIFSGAGQSPEKVKNYYFPYKNFTDETFYLYVNQNDSTDFNCWSMQTGIIGKDTLFSTIIYDKDDRLTESLTEKITPAGSEMTAYRILSNNTNRKIPEYSDCSVLD